MSKRAFRSPFAVALLIGMAGLALSTFAVIPVLTADEPKAASTDAAAKPAEFPVEAVAYFESKVLPLLQARCFECHGPDIKEPKGGLRLDSRTAVLKGGDNGAALVPGNPDESVLIDAVLYKGFEMPPRTRLPEGEVAILKKWVELGAPWSKGGDKPVVRDERFPLEQRKRDHWSWQPIAKAVPPAALKQADWPRNDIDRFILAKLEEKGLTPAPDADRRTLIRRATFTLIGIPPTPAEVDEFLNDPAPTPAAFEKVVDRLLASPHFGEHWARHWLDLVRYAETLGHEFDYPLHHAYQYRDYVIRAFNTDLPYDQFVREQIAGDLLPTVRRHPTEGYNESLIGTGFWFLGEDKHAPVDVRGEEAAKIDNQIDVFTKTFLGLTVACARCHDHKFDAITAKDYYALFGILKSTRRQTGLLDPHAKIAAKAAELETLQLAGTKALLKALPSPGDEAKADFIRYLGAVREVLHGDPKPSDEPTTKGQAPDILFDDFEGETWGDKWTAKGNAFGPGPNQGTLPNQQVVSGFAGKRLVNTYFGGDGTTGTLTSKPFIIERRSIQFLIGGGAHRGQTCFNLLIDGKAVRTATGKDNEKLESASWDVGDFAGESAVLQIVDANQGGWGHVNIDQIVFSDGAGATATKRPIAVVAKERELDPARLRNWVQAINSDEARQLSHPMATWVALAPYRDDEAMNAERVKLYRRQQDDKKNAQNTPEETILFEDFNRGNYSNWFVTGEAFGKRPSIARDWNPQSPGGGMLPAGVAHSGVLSPRLCGVLRSKSFILEHPQILYRAAGKNARIRLIVDGYQMDVFNALLFGGFTFTVNNDEMRWYTQAGDIRRYMGHRCYIELIDDGDDWLAVDEIRFSDGAPPPAAPSHPWNQSTPNSILTTVESLDRSYGARWNHALQAWRSGPAGADPAASEFVPWALDHKLVSLNDADAAFAEPTSKYRAAAADVPTPTRVVAAADGTGEDENVFIRGSHKNLGPVAPRRLLEALQGDVPFDLSRGSGRFELANNLLDVRNPFPSRVMVNRVWHHLFGRGIVPSVDNFGVLGEKPSHPELLDWLASSFQSPRLIPSEGPEGVGKWSVKRLIRQILLSRTWQMASSLQESQGESDPQNILLHRQNLHRLEGESIRDAMLVLSGRLDRTTFGPSIPVHLTPFMQGRGRPGSGPLDGSGRRSIYTSINRNFLSPMMLAFDTPIPFTTIGRRNVSNVPAQALILMNDPFVLEQTKLWARRLLTVADTSSEERITRLYNEAFARAPTDSERAEALAFLNAQASGYGLTDETWPRDERPWADLCHVLVNVKEFIFVD
jgi:hypothetical protein